MSNVGFDVSKIKHRSLKSNVKSNENEGTSILDRELLPFKLNSKRKEIFYIELYSMLGAGMDIKDSLDVIINQQERRKEKEIYSKIKENLIGGKSLHECLELSSYFTPYEFYCVQIGEESGKLVEVLNQLSEYFSKKIKLRQQIVKSLSYPIVILISSLIAIVFMLTFIVPMFSDIFKRFGGDLPQITKFFISMSNVVRNNFVYFALVSFCLVIVFMVIWNKPEFKNQRQKLVCHIPYIGLLVKEIYLARLCSSMALLIGAKVPLIHSISLVKKMIEFYPIYHSLLKLEEDILNGKALHQGMSEHSIYDSKMIALVKVGEEVNKLDVFFEKLDQRFSDNVDVKASALNTFLEPLVIGLLGVIIGVMLVAMYLPMFKLSTSIG